MNSAAPYVPYQPYKSKRHARNTSNQSAANGAASPQSRPQSMISNGHTNNDPAFHQRTGSLTSAEAHARPGTSPAERAGMSRPASMFDTTPQNGHGRSESTVFSFPVRTHSSAPTPPPEVSHTPLPVAPVVPSSPITSIPSSPPPAPLQSPGKPPIPSGDGSDDGSPSASPPVPHAAPSVAVSLPLPNGTSSSSQPVAGPSTSAASPPPSPRKTTTFRRVPLRNPNARTPLPSSPLRPADTHSRTPSMASTQSRQIEPPPVAHTPSQGSSGTPSPSVVAAYDRALPPIPSLDIVSRPASSPEDTMVHTPSSPSSATPPHAHSLGPSPKPQARVLSPAPGLSATQLPSPAVSPFVHERSVARSPAPYRPGFQPKGVYRPRTDEFIEARKSSRDVGRTERTRLERRLEKLINLHFPSESQRLKEKPSGDQRPTPRPNKRLSSIFEMDFSELRSKSATDLWKEVVQPQVIPGGKNDIRAAEQTITPWEDDASVTHCPMCKSAFHSLTNRKHHCRLCGRIICSLPVKVPQRPQPCSLLFVADSKTGRIEEVSEGVDYGVRRRPSATPQARGRGKEETMSEEEKFLKGVRICRDCRPVLLREQYKHETRGVPIFFKLYDAFISLEKDIEDSLPQFQELMLTLRLLEAFGQYDALAKRIRQLPAPSGPGSSQDRIQGAIASRANLFLQKNMFPLQTLPKATNGIKSSPSTSSTTPEESRIDPDSELARSLQPLLEQEALLESFVEEAKAHRKFEDAKTLKTNLQEIRAEINRIVGNADVSVAGNSRKGSTRTRRS
ncbi:FYVE zinc finger-domain-containing protein [Fomitopsis serialis]|uniref:FYVE zinc finger-domain-containing protein n=1 Tax=Fomitopsis serialis TaxID=139415 RepID=UPI002008B41B|nr:FYVE zinc finger-domain-containing protein [Neoantrodia serialis]KAH9934700.1 FYVE zinc finger-domain-containing protein [Neoantrodia serialis]